MLVVKNTSNTYDTYLSSGQILPNVILTQDPTLLVNLYERLQQADDRKQAADVLKSIKKEYEFNEQSNRK